MRHIRVLSPYKLAALCALEGARLIGKRGTALLSSVLLLLRRHINLVPTELPPWIEGIRSLGEEPFLFLDSLNMGYITNTTLIRGADALGLTLTVNNVDWASGSTEEATSAVLAVLGAEGGTVSREAFIEAAAKLGGSFSGLRGHALVVALLEAASGAAQCQDAFDVLLKGVEGGLASVALTCAGERAVIEKLLRRAAKEVGLSVPRKEYGSRVMAWYGSLDSRGGTCRSLNLEPQTWMPFKHKVNSKLKRNGRWGGLEPGRMVSPHRS